MFPTSHQICELQDPPPWDASTKSLHDRQMSVTDKDDRDFCVTIQPRPTILKKDRSMGNDPVGS